MIEVLKVILSEKVSTQHRFLVMDLEIKVDKRKTLYDWSSIKWGGPTPRLSREMEGKLSSLGALRSSRDVNNMRDITVGFIRKVATEVLEYWQGLLVDVKVIRGVIEKFKAKWKLRRFAYTKWLECIDEDEKWRLKDIYKKTKTKAKPMITSVKTVAFERLYIELGEKARTKDCIVSHARERERESEKLATWTKWSASKMRMVRYLWTRLHLSKGGKHTSTNSQMKKETEILSFGNLVHSDSLWNFGYCKRFRVEEVWHTICRMSGERATESDAISMEFGRALSRMVWSIWSVWLCCLMLVWRLQRCPTNGGV